MSATPGDKRYNLLRIKDRAKCDKAPNYIGKKTNAGKGGTPHILSVRDKEHRRATIQPTDGLLHFRLKNDIFKNI